jgi:hypothetical protein
MMPADLSPAERRLARTLIAIAGVAMLLLVTQGRPWELFARGAFSSDFYDAQAEAILHGRLAIDPKVAAMEGFRVKPNETHIYFGVMLAIVRLPVVLFTDSLAGQLSRLSILLAYVGGLVAAVHLAQATRLLVVPGLGSRTSRQQAAADPDPSEPDDGTADPEPEPARADGRWRIATFIVAMALSPALFAGGWVSIYHETELWACTLAVASAAFSFRLLGDPSPRWAYLAAGTATLATMTRVTTGIGAVAAAFVAIAVVYRTDVRRIVGPAVVAVLGGLVHAVVNTGRFGSPTAIPVTRQFETIVNAERAAWFADHGNSYFSLGFLPSTLLAYLRPDALRIERVAPFLRFGPQSDELGGADFESITPSTSLTVSATLLLVLAIAGTVWAIRNRRFAILGILACGLAQTVPTLTIGYIANRYLIDFLPPLAAAAALAVWLPIPERLPVRAGVAVLAGWGLLVNLCLAVWIGNAESPGFIEGRFRIDQDLFAAPSPGIETLDDRALEEAPFGTVLVDRGADGACNAVYVVGSTALMAVERTDGELRVAGTTRVGDVTLVDNGRWSIELRRTGDVIIDMPRRKHPFVKIDAEPGEEVAYVIVVDPRTDESYMYIDGEGAFLPEPMLEDPGLEGDAGAPGPLCRLMTEQLSASG